MRNSFFRYVFDFAGFFVGWIKKICYLKVFFSLFIYRKFFFFVQCTHTKSHTHIYIYNRIRIYALLCKISLNEILRRRANKSNRQILKKKIQRLFFFVDVTSACIENEFFLYSSNAQQYIHFIIRSTKLKLLSHFFSMSIVLRHKICILCVPESVRIVLLVGNYSSCRFVLENSGCTHK